MVRTASDRARRRNQGAQNRAAPSLTWINFNTQFRGNLHGLSPSCALSLLKASSIGLRSSEPNQQIEPTKSAFALSHGAAAQIGPWVCGRPKAVELASE